MNEFSRTFVSVLVAGLLLALTLPLVAQDMGSSVEPIVTVQNVMWQDGTVVEDSEAILTRMEHGLSMSIETSGLQPGDVFTIWWVIYNAPQNCTDGVCSFDDVFLMDDEAQFILDEAGGPQFNPAGIENAQISSMRATNGIAYEDGTAVFRAHVPIGDMTDYVNFGNGLFDPMTAEVHLIIRTHGPAQPEILTDQLFTATGGCVHEFAPPCADPQFAVFAPPSLP